MVIEMSTSTICNFTPVKRRVKRFALLLGIAAGSIFVATAADAQNYPWCAQYSGGMGGAMNCGFSTFTQCQADVSGIGGFCIRNNTYQPNFDTSRRRRWQ
jgi:hypothetical protein